MVTKYMSVSNLQLVTNQNKASSINIYSSVPDLSRGQNKNVVGKAVKTTDQIKTTGSRSKNLTPYKNLTSYFLKTIGSIKPTGVTCSTMISEKPQG